MEQTTRADSKEYYDNTFLERQIRTGVNKRHLSIFKYAVSLGLKPNHSVLEIGCGIGTLSSLLMKYLNSDGHLFSCDLSAESIKYAKEKYIEYHNCEFHEIDGSNIMLGRKFDMIIMPDSCEHIPIEHHNRMFKNISKMLKEDGIVYVHIPHPYCIEWMKIYNKEELQIIDQPLYLSDFCEIIKDTDLYVFSELPYNIWNNDWSGKYTHRVLRIKSDFTNYKPATENKTSLSQKLMCSRIISANKTKMIIDRILRKLKVK